MLKIVTNYNLGLKFTIKNPPEAPLPKIFKKGLLLSLIHTDLTPMSTCRVEERSPLEKIPRNPPITKFSKRGYYWLRSGFLAPKIFKKGLLLSLIHTDVTTSIDIYGGGSTSTRKNSPEAHLP
jgi:hypothetical protein